MYLYCQGCNAYIGGLATICPFCDFDHSEEAQERYEEAPSLLYCPECSNYLGSLGGKSCSCGWHAGQNTDEF